ncbi:MAG: hypothetical protein NAOJABEB_02359 [Steroidobacteraceae bacterium]|nr:hypothetical protein [Steroidobacteraceae bacterium]
MRGFSVVDSTSPGALADYSAWRARDYFETYYSEVVLPDEQAVLAYQLEVMRRADVRYGRALEYGCGPTLHRAIAAAAYAARIDMADWLADNLVFVREWLASDAMESDWNRFTHFILQCEGTPDIDPVRIAHREAQARKAIHGLYVSDARWHDPLGEERRGYYDLVVSGFCLDAVSSDRGVWRACMQNVLSMLAPGGTIVIHALHDCTAYKVGERMFPGAGVTVDAMAESLLENDLTRASLDVQVIPCPDNAVYGYSGILTASARKPPTP